MLRIVFKNEEVIYYGDCEFTDYKYDGKCFIVINEKQWVGIYNMDCIACVEYVDDCDLCSDDEEYDEHNTYHEDDQSTSKEDTTENTTEDKPKKVRVYIVDN